MFLHKIPLIDLRVMMCVGNACGKRIHAIVVINFNTFNDFDEILGF